MTASKSTIVVRNLLPILNWLPDYNVDAAISDGVAGLTVGLMVIPQSIAFALIAELSPEYGLYSAFMSSFVYIFLGSVKDISMGPTTLMALMSNPMTKMNPGYAPLLSLVTGTIVLLCGILQLGFFVDFVSIPVVSGFTSAASFTIMSKQMNSLLGVRARNGSGSTRLPGILSTYEELIVSLPDANWPDAVLGLSCSALLLLLKELPRLRVIRTSENDGMKKICWYLSIGRNALAVVICAAIAYINHAMGNEDIFRLTGDVKTGLPPLSLPNFGLSGHFADLVMDLDSLLFTLPLIAVIGQIAIAKSFSKNKALDATQEFLALGVCNIVGSLVCAMPVNASFGRSAVNAASGVKTPMGGAVTGVVVLSALLFMMPFCAFIPKASLASVVITAVVFNIDLAIIVKLWRSKRLDLLPFGVTALACLLWRLEYGILIGMAVNLSEVLFNAAKPRINIVDETERVTFQVLSGLSFPSGSHVWRTVESHLMRKEGRYERVVLDLAHVTTLDFTTASTLRDLVLLMEAKSSSVALMNVREDLQSQLLTLMDERHFKDAFPA